jgi:hypothetical protein
LCSGAVGSSFSMRAFARVGGSASILESASVGSSVSVRSFLESVAPFLPWDLAVLLRVCRSVPSVDVEVQFPSMA